MATPLPFRPEPEILQVLRNYRLSLIDRESVQTKRLAQSWFEMEVALNDQMQLLAFELLARKEKGDVITEQLIRRMERYQSLKNQLKDQVLRYTQQIAVPDIESEQLAYGELGFKQAAQAITGASAPSIGVQFDRLPVDAIEDMVGLLGNGSPLNTLLQEAYPDALDGIAKGLLNGLAQGLSPDKIAYDMAQGMGLGLERITLIARTEQLRVWRTSTERQYQNSNGAVLGKKRLAARDACMACLVLDGEFIPLGEPLSDHPRGRCTSVPVVRGAPELKWETGKEWFEKQSEELQRERMGDQAFELWKAGAFQLEDLAMHKHSDEWGDSLATRPVIQLLNKGGGDDDFEEEDEDFDPDLLDLEDEMLLAEEERPTPQTRESTTGIKILPSEATYSQGAFYSERVHIVGDGEAILKENISRGVRGPDSGLAYRETIAYEIDQLLGLDIVPKTSIFEDLDGKIWSLQEWVQNSMVGGDFRLGDVIYGQAPLKEPSDPGRVTLLDIILGNRDRHGGNWLMTSDGRIAAIDHGLGLISDGEDPFDYFELTEWRVFKDVQKAITAGEAPLYLPLEFKLRLEKLLASGELEELIDQIESLDGQREGLTHAAIRRIELVLRDWDKIFRSEV